jgi:hypothetical protein
MSEGVKLTRRCEVLPPNYNGDMGRSTGCPLPFAHDGPHESNTARHGWIRWADDDECECCIGHDERCIWFERLPAGRAALNPEGR